MTAKLFITSLLAATLAVSAQARTPVPECDVQTAEQTFEVEAFDLGNGMTAFLENRGPDGDNVGTSLVVISCFTGRFVEATVWTGDAKNPTEYPQTLSIFEDTAEPNAIVTFEALAEQFDAQGVPTVHGISRQETCACAIAYPGLRGTKTGYDTL